MVEPEDSPGVESLASGSCGISGGKEGSPGFLKSKRLIHDVIVPFSYFFWVFVSKLNALVFLVSRWIVFG